MNKIKSNTQVLSSIEAFKYCLKNDKSDNKFLMLILDTNNNVIELNNLSPRSFNENYFNFKYMTSLIIKASGRSIYLIERISFNDYYSFKGKLKFFKKLIQMTDLFNIKVCDYMLVFHDKTTNEI
ncbi:hypothetical protein E1J38_013300 [Seonamhaeicola sediminis]|uniref:RadC-like JAB domain-containing protein n=1 Tax=Seonamhaeicola sediminis TaxID=2528206 RepID=A0A562YBN6_9FLAO|nr:hypothetical protein E1J38_013300 [Seonamhaeicola sediminis]